MPGCSARFECGSKDELMAQVAAHAAEEHGITQITPEVQQAVESRILVAS